MWARFSLKFQLTLLVVSIVAVASWAFGKLAFRGLLETLESTTGLRAQTAAEVIASSLDPKWLAGVEPTAAPDSEYRFLEQQGAWLRERGQVERLVVIRIIDDGQMEYVLNHPADNSTGYRPPGHRENRGSEDPLLFRTEGYGGLRNEAGVLMGGWAPVRNEGEAVGFVVVAIDANDVQNALDTAYMAISVSMLLFVLLTGITAYKLSASFEKTAVTDGLMGIYNHKYFKQRLVEEVAKASRYKQQTAIVLLDIDYFKRVNDTFGHATGDLVLKNLARWVTDSSRTTDVVARYGGEEVAVILPHTGMAGAQEFAERLRLKVSHQVVSDPEEDAEFRITISVGVAQWERGLDAGDLIRRADAALYQSKNAGRNRVTLYQDDILPRPIETEVKTGS